MRNRGSRSSGALIVLIALLLTGSIALAQTTASIIGTITDDSGAVVPQTAITNH